MPEPSTQSDRDGAPSPASILVTGDVVRDLYIYPGDRVLPAQQGKIAPYFADRPGGAAGLYALIATARPHVTFFGVQIRRSLAKLLPVHALWTACPGGTKQEAEDAGRKDRPSDVWRTDRALGYALGSTRPPALPKRRAADAHHAVLVMDDAALCFRTISAKGSWPAGIRPEHQPQPNWIVHKMANPIAQGDLWRALVGGSVPGQRDNLIVVVAADELRRAGAAISRGFSWERTLTELCAELDGNPLFQPLLRFPRYLVVNFGCVGAIWFGNDSRQRGGTARVHDCATLVYDPSLPEGGWKGCLADEHAVYGHLNTFTAAIALAAADTPRHAPLALDAAVQRGLTACRLLRLLGHGPVSAERPGPPLDRLAAVLCSTSTSVPSIAADTRTVIPQGWQVIPGACSGVAPTATATWTLAALAENPLDRPDLPLFGLAHRVALYGYPALQHIPHAHFGRLLSVAHGEIETLRSLCLLMRRYGEDRQPRQPLSIAAFGPPGAGKSFGIQQIAWQALGGGAPIEEMPFLEFNLAQFSTPADLFGAFHQVRDKALKGPTPVVFWDEFDSRGYEWLQYLLAPMQDGTFQENGHTHAIGKCVFVFAGATSWDFEHFGPAPLPHGWGPSHSADPKAALADPDPEVRALAARYVKEPGLLQSEAKARAEFVGRKGPDFLSRIDGHIDVLGPNPCLRYDWTTRTWSLPDPRDVTFPVRRALLLRQFLGARKPDDTLAIDRDLLRAFLHVPRYRHGARSLEKIARPLALSATPFRYAHIPPPQVLAQHLETAEAFKALYLGDRDFVSAGNLLQIAAAIDENYQRHEAAVAAAKASASGTPYVPRPALGTAAFVKAFGAKLASPDPWEKWLAATNLAAALRMPYILDLAGLRLERGTPTAAELAAVQAHLEKHLVSLAREEHALWMQCHRDNGWRQAGPGQLTRLRALRVRSPVAYEGEIRRLKKDERVHTLMVPFEALSDEEKPKDHDAIRNYPGTVALVGWKIAFGR